MRVHQNLTINFNPKSAIEILLQSKTASFLNSGLLKGTFSSTFLQSQNPVILRFSPSLRISITEFGFKVKNQYRNWLQLFIIVLLLSLKNTINAQDLIRTNINDSIKHSIIFNQNTLKPFGNGGLNYYEKDKLLAYDTSFSNNIDKYFSTHQYVKFNWTIHHKYVNLVFLPQYLIIYFSADHPHNKTLVYIEKVNLKIFEKIHTSAIQGKLTDTHFSGGTYNSLSYGFSQSLKLHDSISNPSDSILQQLIFENFKELNSILHKNISLKIQKPKVEDIQVNSSICLGMPEIFQLSNLPLSATIPLKKEKKKSIKNNPK